MAYLRNGIKMSRELFIELFTIYQDLLTSKQQKIFKSYYFEDLSLSEISENYNTSRSYISKTLQIINEKLADYESTLKIRLKYKKILDLIDNPELKTKINEIINE